VGKILLNGNDLTLEQILNIAENYYAVELVGSSVTKIKEGRKKLDEQMDNRPDIPIYGTNRLHGDLKLIEVKSDLLETYQEKYIKVHNCGTGEPLPIPVVRAMMVVRLNSFAKGMSGMQIETCNMLVDMLNKKVTPQVLEEGSVGASGDLIPLAMIGATMIGLQEAIAYFDGEEMLATEALSKAGLAPIRLGAKEAMGLTNGSNFMAAMAIFGVRDAKKLLDTAAISTALSLEAIRGEKRAFGDLINEQANRHNGQIVVAKQIRELISDSKRCTKKCQEDKSFYEKGTERVQDRYSFRCTPQVHCALYDAIEKIEQVLKQEINSVTDNPLFDFDKIDMETGGIVFASGGNFHGQPLAAPIDYLKITLTSLGLLSDRRAFALLDESLSYGLPGDLAKDVKGAADGGYMIAQYAGAARCAENKVLSAPASVTSIATAANQEDYVSMGSVGVVHLRKIIENVEKILAIELLCATRGLQLLESDLDIPTSEYPLATKTQKVYDKLKNLLGEYEEDTYIKSEMDKIIEVVKKGDLLAICWKNKPKL